MESSTDILAVSQLHKQVPAGNGPLTLLSDINLQVKPGETVALVGPSGSGKSTLLGLLAGLDQPSSGDVALFGQSIGQLDEDARARLRAGRVGFVFQSFQLLSGFTALENVQIALELAGEQESPERAQAMLERLGLGHRLTHYPSQLSGGEQQRVALARAFITEPELLFADEPTGNLDGETGQVIVDLMFELNSEHHSALVLVTHDETLASRCQRRFIMRDGKVSEQ